MLEFVLSMCLVRKEEFIVFCPTHINWAPLTIGNCRCKKVSTVLAFTKIPLPRSFYRHQTVLSLTSSSSFSFESSPASLATTSQCLSQDLSHILNLQASCDTHQDVNLRPLLYLEVISSTSSFKCHWYAVNFQTDFAPGFHIPVFNSLLDK